MYDGGTLPFITTRRVPQLGIGVLLLTLFALGCSERGRPLRSADFWFQGGPPDVLPQVQNPALPFRYPVAEYLRHLQGNVTLRLFVSESGTLVPDSTRIEVSSGVPAFDSAALAGASLLQFRPARRGGTPIPVVLLFPVHFRHPGVPRTSGDTLP